jgi:hypothetical protein
MENPEKLATQDTQDEENINKSTTQHVIDVLSASITYTIHNISPSSQMRSAPLQINSNAIHKQINY